MSKCRVCEHEGARDVQLYVALRQQQHSFVVRVCRDCWRTFEAMLHQATLAHQLSLVDGWVDVLSQREKRFIW